MNGSGHGIRALGLCSGGLDSILSALLLRDQGIHVEWISFETPFFTAVKARKAATTVNIPLIVENITRPYMQMLLDPPCGYGRNMNPCMDCHALMFRLAGDRMMEKGFHFLFSGEVLDQRPMSQTRQSLRYVEKHSGYDGLILRPLSARRLPETPMEERGWVDRQRLLDLYGRSRKPQIALAEAWGITEYPSPAGGCLLTDANYSRRLKDYLEHTAGWREPELEILKLGRHLRLNPSAKLVVGRSQSENESLLETGHGEQVCILRTPRHPGPVGLLMGEATETTIHQAAAALAVFSRARSLNTVEVSVERAPAVSIVKVKPLSKDLIRKWII